MGKCEGVTLGYSLRGAAGVLFSKPDVRDGGIECAYALLRFSRKGKCRCIDGGKWLPRLGSTAVILR